LRVATFYELTGILGPEAYAFSELGDGLALTANTGTLKQVRVIMSSWACQSGHWYSGDCVTSPEATFSQPITVNVYPVAALIPGPLLATITKTFDIPYRPSSTPSLCGGDPNRWYNRKDKTCYHGIASMIVVNFSGSQVPLPSNGEVVVTVAYNTTHYGPSPIGESASCYTSSGGCPYDSLNISTDTTDGNFQFVGAPLDANGIFVNYTLPNNSCTGTIATGVLTDDTGCWAGLHPEIEVKANTNGH
jgi:hypothetical protein